tara:strand:- start:11484 stop:12596 length:1113 start_codon:yes stop_codon:yes gene_type:complete
MKPLNGIKVLDFTTLLPGPLATLMLCDAGAEVIKIEKIGGEEMRKAEPKISNESVLFAMLNRGKKSIEVDLKNPNYLKKIKKLILKCDVLVEQFRPGVMEKLGLGWKQVYRLNKKIVYCSITGYGQSGLKKHKAGHDLNYLAESGLLKLSHTKYNSPVLPITQIADIAGGSYPAFINILLALFNAKIQKKGSFLDISMYENLIPLAWLGLSNLNAGKFDENQPLNLNGKLARYNIYETKDKKYIALGALEDKFWIKFCNIIKAPEEIKLEKFSQSILIDKVQSIIKKHSEEYWKKKFDSENNACCSTIKSLKEFMQDKHIKNKKIFSKNIIIANKKLFAIPTILDKNLIKIKKNNTAPKLGQNNNLIENL